MPTYEYECLASGKQFEKFQSMTDEPLDECPECGGPVRRLIGTGSAILFKRNGSRARDHSRASDSGTRCGRSSPCCGRDVPCDSPPCGD